MGVIDQMKQAMENGLNHVKAARLITQYLNEVAEARGRGVYEYIPEDYLAGQTILGSETDVQAAVLLNGLTLSERDRIWRLSGLIYRLLCRNLPLTMHDLERLLKHGLDSDERTYWAAVLRRIQRAVEQGEVLTPSLRARLQELLDHPKPLPAGERGKVRGMLESLLGGDQVSLLDSCDQWAKEWRTDWETIEPTLQAAWSAVLQHTATADGSKPSRKWLAEAQKNRDAIGDAEFISRMTAWLSKVAPPSPFTETAPERPANWAPTREYVDSQEHKDYSRASEEYWKRVQAYLGGISEKNIAILKGLAWYSAPLADTGLARALGRLTEQALTNLPHRGAWAKSVANAAIWALGQMPGAVGVGPLARLRTRLRDRSALKLIAAAIESAAQSAGMSVDDLEDLAVPTGGLGADGTRRETFGEDGAALLTLDAKNAKTNCQWFGPDGQPRKAVPKNVKTNFPAEVKALKAAETEIQQALSAQSARFDRFLLDERAWTYGVWRERYLTHPVLGNLARRLIWTVDGIPALPDDLPEGLPDTADVRLWHPLGETPVEVLRWRQMLETRGIVQPFKQAHREVYLLTDAERNTRTYSNRFAAHILKQHQFNSLCILRGWKNALRLMVDDSYPPATRELPRWNLRAEFWVEGIGDDYGTDTNETGTYLRLVTDQVRFYPLDAATNHAHAGGGGYAGPNWQQGPAEALPLEDIPPLVFSEVMRDVDLFVGVASVGNDPTWSDGGPGGRYINYWHDYAFGELTETAKTRAAVLARLLPRLKIADRCRLDGKFLIVRGDLRTYKIHLGSGNILMEPNDQYLCIVPNSRAADSDGDLFLPFEGDRVLAVILSKAFLLAADKKITDPTITRQIGGKITA